MKIYCLSFRTWIIYRCVPDVWGLHEWSNWLTPYVSRDAKRYDTFFYKAALLEYPEYAREDNVETTKLMVRKVFIAIENTYILI